MRKYVPLLIAGSALIAAACRDSIAPNEATEAAELYKVDRSFSAIVAPPTNSSTLRFVLSPGGGSVNIGAFTLDYDANAVCNPATSGYGEGYWKRSCEALGAPITITATSWTENDRQYTEFSPDIRFAPGKVVQLSVLRPQIVGDDLTFQEMLTYNIWYLRRVGRTGYFVDEGWSDPWVRTHFDTETGRVWRNIRHFSGWSVRSGDCDTSSGEVCIATTVDGQ